MIPAFLIGRGRQLESLGLVTTPGVLAPGSDAGGFLLKDIILLGAAVHAAGTSLIAAVGRQAPETSQLTVPGGH
ncbi:MAG TPA: hypothetical protein VMT11_16745 [Myxococcaceae bacterium]|nr:hypothetical protein [Myxococcaceae bacterium]